MSINSIAQRPETVAWKTAEAAPARWGRMEEAAAPQRETDARSDVRQNGARAFDTYQEEAPPASAGLYQRTEGGASPPGLDAPAASPAQGERAPAERREEDAKAAPGGAPADRQEQCTVNTDRVDREIEKLKQKKEELTRQMERGARDPRAQDALQKQLLQVERALQQKDNDGYRREHAVIVNETAR